MFHYLKIFLCLYHARKLKATKRSWQSWNKFPCPRQSHTCPKCHISKLKFKIHLCVPVNACLDQTQYIQPVNSQMPSQLWALYLFSCSISFQTRLTYVASASHIFSIFSSFLLIYPRRASCLLTHFIVLPKGDYLLHEVLKFVTPNHL